MAPLLPNTGRPQVLPANPMQDAMMRPGMMPVQPNPKNVPMGPQVQPNLGGTGGTAINPVDRGDGKAPPVMQYQPPAPQPAPGGAPQVSPGRTALIRSVMARAGQPKGGMGQPQVGRPMPQMAKPRAPIFKPPGG
jgi:hypothetical protein